jgi:hypothetical protein
MAVQNLRSPGGYFNMKISETKIPVNKISNPFQNNNFKLHIAFHTLLICVRYFYAAVDYLNNKICQCQ